MSLVSRGAGLINDVINSLAPLRETDGSTAGLGGPFFQHTPSHKVLPTFTLPLGSGGKQKLEVCCVLFPGAERREGGGRGEI